MKYFCTCILATSMVLNSCNTQKKTAPPVEMKSEMPPQSALKVQQPPFSHPTTRQDASIVDDYHGTKVADPYRWLEDDNSTETKNWVKAQNEVTFAYLKQLPLRNELKNRLEKIWNYEKYGAPFKEGGKYYFFKNNGLQNQSVLYQQDNLNAPPSVLLDPNTLSKEGTAALGGLEFNQEGTLMAYQIAKAGSDWQTIYIRDLQTKTDLPDKIERVKFSGIAWLGNGFFYSRYPEPAKGKELSAKVDFHSVYFHELGTPQEKDAIVYNDATNPNRMHGVGVSEDKTFSFLNVSESTSGEAIYFRKNEGKSKDWTPIVTTFEHDFAVLDNDGDRILIRTNKNASNYRLIAVDAKNPQEANWKNVIPESEDVLQSVIILNKKLVATYMHNACSKLKIFDLQGKWLGELTLPGIGTVGSFSGKRDESQAFYTFSAYTRPNTIYELDMNTLKSKVFKAPKLDFDADAYETKQVWYDSKDGTKVSMFLTYKKGTKLDGTNPTLLYGYGGFNISLLPQFAVTRTVLLEKGGILAVPNLRGGGEFGEKWHKAGTKERKQNVFDDFIAAAAYLIKNKYTSKDYLAIEGGSNGGLLVGACMTQRPDLFRVCFPRVGVLDMLRYHRFTIGRAWATDYGLSEEKVDFQYLMKYSPLHNLKKTAYPATLVMTADHDDRVVPAHSFKYAAALQAHQQGNNPTLIRIETAAGHGAGKPTSKLIEEAADMLAFMFFNMGK
jgi:prolyl oligopeptidase